MQRPSLTVRFRIGILIFFQVILVQDPSPFSSRSPILYHRRVHLHHYLMFISIADLLDYPDDPRTLYYLGFAHFDIFLSNKDNPTQEHWDHLAKAVEFYARRHSLETGNAEERWFATLKVPGHHHRHSQNPPPSHTLMFCSWARCMNVSIAIGTKRFPSMKPPLPSIQRGQMLGFMQVWTIAIPTQLCATITTTIIIIRTRLAPQRDAGKGLEVSVSGGDIAHPTTFIVPVALLIQLSCNILCQSIA